MSNEIPGRVGKIRLLRLLAGFSQVELARALYTTQTRISQIERGEKALSAKEEKLLARKIGLPCDVQKI